MKYIVQKYWSEVEELKYGISFYFYNLSASNFFIFKDILSNIQNFYL